MCGISVAINAKSLFACRKMHDATVHRGLHSYYWNKDKIQIWFRWLPITDSNISTPYFTCGDYTVFLNGFISNWKELADKYNIHSKTSCDTEILAKFIEKFNGKRLDELNGFFAVVYVVDGVVHTFTDRYGIKQLYSYKEGDSQYICSEVKGILALKDEWKLSEDGVKDWMYALGVINEHTVYQGINRLPKLPLSGGIDSGIIAKSIQPDYCFSVDYLEEEYSEAETLKANSVGRHFTLIASEHIYNEYKEKTLQAIDDPKVGSCYTNFALTELASNFVTVLFSGAGGDEFFGGYPHRLNKPIQEVIKRTDYQSPDYHDYPSHFEYDLKFLQGVLIVEDRIGSYFTLETRYPLLDNDFINFAMTLPDEYLENKRILKDISGLSDKVLNAKKRGFSNPHCTNKEWVDFVLNTLKDEK
jgi:asparagine synthetase B (glutamine-hydrolysing)